MFKVVTEVLNNTNIRAVWQPWKEIYVIFFKPGLDNLGCMLWVIVLLEIKSMWVHVKVMVGTKDIIFEYLTV